MVGDTATAFSIALYDVDGSLLDLTDATATFVLNSTGDAPETVVSAENCTISGSVVSYAPSGDDVDTAGVYIGQFTVVFADTTIGVMPPILYEIVESVTVIGP
jgi:hypothetical protein